MGVIAVQYYARTLMRGEFNEASRRAAVGGGEGDDDRAERVKSRSDHDDTLATKQGRRRRSGKGFGRSRD